jgi:hypothetical protein
MNLNAERLDGGAEKKISWMRGPAQRKKSAGDFIAT